MQIFRCPSCGSRVYFDNTTCRCGQEIAYDPQARTMLADFLPCANRARIACNWVAGSGGWCRSCAMTTTVPDIGEPDNLMLWKRTAGAQRWMLAGLARWGWFSNADAGARPVFRFLSERTSTGAARVVMGHANGTVTINVTEARIATRRARQEQFGELYRTMIGHMRHEMAHFLHLRLLARDGFADAFRALFGDERADYGAALKRHYAAPKPRGDAHVTSYATAHPHEDWAETTAHLLHLVDLIDSAAAAGIVLPSGPPEGYDAYADPDTQRMIGLAVDASLAVNHVNRAMDLPDLYPFVLTPLMREKLAFAHGWLRSAGR